MNPKEEIAQGVRMSVAMEADAMLLMGKIIILDRGPATDVIPNTHAILVGGVLVSEDGCPLSAETLDANGCEQWDVEIVLRPIAKRRGLSATHRSTLGKLLINGLNEPGFWDEQFNPETGEWKEQP